MKFEYVRSVLHPKEIDVISQEDLPGGGHYGFSAYRGVLVEWDEDHDERVLTLIDQLDPQDRKNLVIAHEHKGCVVLVWRWNPPPEYETGKFVIIQTNSAFDDQWSVESRSFNDRPGVKLQVA